MMDIKDVALAAVGLLGGGVGVKLLTRKADIRQVNAAAGIAEAGRYGQPFAQATELMVAMGKRVAELEGRVEALEDTLERVRDERQRYRMRLIALGQSVDDSTIVR